MERSNDPLDAAGALESQFQHVERQARFALDMATALRDEFAVLWRLPDKRGYVTNGDAFVAQVDALDGLVKRYLADLAKARQMPPAQAQRLLKLLEVAKLLERGRGLEGAARTMRNAPSYKVLKPEQYAGGRTPGPVGLDAYQDKPRSPTGPLPAAPPPGAPGAAGRRLTERLQDALERYTVTAVQPQVVAPPPPPTPAERRIAAFEAALGLVGDVLADAGPRLGALKVALACSRPGGIVELEAKAKAQGVPGDLRGMLPAIVHALATGPMTRRAAAIALDQWDQAARLADAFEKALAAARRAQATEVARILAPYDAARLKGLIVPLTNLHLTFRGSPALAELFPPPVKRRLEPAIPDPAAPPPPRDPDEATDAAAAGEAGPADEEEAPPQASAATVAALASDEVSRRRMALIAGWMDDPEANEALRDITVIYRIVAEEREYQQDRVSDLGMRLRLMPPMEDGEPPQRGSDRQALRDGMEAARLRQAQLQEVLQFVLEFQAMQADKAGEDAYVYDEADYAEAAPEEAVEEAVEAAASEEEPAS